MNQGIKPAALRKVTDPAVRRLIDRCLAPASRRPSALELLSDPFLLMEDDGSTYGDGDYASMYNYLHQPAACPGDRHAGGSNASSATNGDDDLPPEDRYSDCEEDDDDDSRFQGIDMLFNEHEDDEHVAGVDIAIKGKRMDDGGIYLRLCITDKNDTALVRKIYFPFDAESDTALSVATEMVGELDITDHEATHIADMIDGEVGKLLPHWRPGPGVDDDAAAPPDARCQNCQSSASSGGSLADYMPAAAARRGCRFEEITFQDDQEQVPFQSSGCSSDQGQAPFH